MQQLDQLYAQLFCFRSDLTGSLARPGLTERTQHLVAGLVDVAATSGQPREQVASCDAPQILGCIELQG